MKISIWARVLVNRDYRKERVDTLIHFSFLPNNTNEDVSIKLSNRSKTEFIISKSDLMAIAKAVD